MSELRSWIDALARIGTTGEGGVYRASYTLEEREVQEMVAGWMGEAGMRVWRDAVGNLWGRVEGAEASAPAIVTGSHLDSVKNGGNYDGPYGVLASLMAVREAVRRHGPPRLPLEVVAFTGEEASRFSLGLLGSRGVVGILERGNLDEIVDARGTTVAEGMRQVGLDPDRIGDARREDIGAFLEIHIEQGPVLDSAGIPIGVVRSIVGFQRVIVAVHGRADHAGTTPMHLRRDAMLGAARMIGRLPEMAARFGVGVMTCGYLAAFPGASNVVPERVEFTLDIRHPDQATKLEMVERAREMCEAVAADAGLGLTWTIPVPGGAAVALSDRVQDLLRESCRELGVSYLDMPSGAGHDAQLFAPRCPTGMLFIPCKDGRSHSPAEFAADADMEAGMEVLSRCIHKLAYEKALVD